MCCLRQINLKVKIGSNYMENRNTTNEMIKRFNQAKEFEQDYFCYNKCKMVLNNYSRQEAIIYTQELIKRYESQINQFGLLDGKHVVYNVDYSVISDMQILDQIIYIGQRIPVYALIREGEKKLAEELLNRIGYSGFII